MWMGCRGLLGDSGPPDYGGNGNFAVLPHRPTGVRPDPAVYCLSAEIGHEWGVECSCLRGCLRLTPAVRPARGNGGQFRTVGVTAQFAQERPLADPFRGPKGLKPRTVELFDRINRAPLSTADDWSEWRSRSWHINVGQRALVSVA